MNIQFKNNLDTVVLVIIPVIFTPYLSDWLLEYQAVILLGIKPLKCSPAHLLRYNGKSE